MAEGQHTGVTEVREEQAATIVALIGDVDLKNSPHIHHALEAVCERRPERIILDLARVGYMDSSGVGTLVWVYRQVQGYGGSLVLAGMNEKVRAVLEITQLDQFFTVCATLDEALQA